ncbi:MAG: MFS transporter [Bacteroidales bacterium]
MKEQKVKISEMVRHNPVFLFLFLLCIGTSIGFQGWRTLFNNFAIEEVGLNGFNIGAIQSLREIPGFLSLAVVFLLLFIQEKRLIIISCTFLALGVILTGFLPSFTGLLMTTFIMSLGFHYFETTNQSITLQNFSQKESPFVLANLKSVVAFSNIFAGGLIFILSNHLNYSTNYTILGLIVLLFIITAFIKTPRNCSPIPQNKNIVLKKKYWLFYVLNFLSGARRQIFVVFAVLLMVEKYNFTIAQVSVLFILNNIIAIFTNPIIARLINNFGEKTTLRIEYSALAIIFFSYAYFDSPIIAASLYIFDHIFFNFSIGIRTYFQKHADPKDIAPSMAAGFTINHIAAVILPFIGGMVWLINWRIPFIAAVVLCFISLGFIQFMKPYKSCENIPMKNIKKTKTF